MASIKGLKAKAKDLNSSGGIDFMDGREKGASIPEGVIMTIDDFGFIKGNDGDFVVLSFEEYPGFFYFGGGVVTDKMKELEEFKGDIQNEGLPVVFMKKTNKKGKRDYMSCEFYPNEGMSNEN